MTEVNKTDTESVFEAQMVHSTSTFIKHDDEYPYARTEGQKKVIRGIGIGSLGIVAISIVGGLIVGEDSTAQVIQATYDVATVIDESPPTSEEFIDQKTTLSTVSENELILLLPEIDSTTTSTTTTVVPETTIPIELAATTVAETVPLGTVPEIIAVQSVYEQLDCTQPTIEVQSGMVFGLIAERCGVSVETLTSYNPNTDPNLILPGLQLNMQPGAVVAGNQPPSSVDCDSLQGVEVKLTGPSHIRDHLIYNIGLSATLADNIMFRASGSYLTKYGLNNPLAGTEVCMAGSFSALQLQYPNTLR